MDDTVPRLIGLLLAGAVALLGLRSQIGGTPQGERTFRVILIVFLIVVGVAAYLLVREQDQALPPVPPGETTVADAPEGFGLRHRSAIC